MKKIQSLAMMMGFAITGALSLTACSSSSDAIEENKAVVYDENGQATVKSEFVFSVPRKVVGTTRMKSEDTQSEGTVAQFRGMDNIRLIPFGEDPDNLSTKLSDIMRLSSIDVLGKPGQVNYKVYSDQFVPVGTNHFLLYAKAIDWAAESPITSMDDKFKFGTLSVKGLTDAEFTAPKDILFSPVQINTSTEAQAGDEVGRNIVQLLTSLANITVSGVAAPNNSWKTSNHPTMAALYKNFIGITTSSSGTLSVILSKLYFSLDHIKSADPAYTLAQTIKSRIEAVCAYAPVNGVPVTLKSSYSGYPGNVGLPDGAARIRWNASGLQANSFVDVSANYTKNFRLKITDYVYPAALWYFVSTPLKASNEKESPEYDTAGNWDGVINSVYAGAADEVQTGTQSVALNKPAEYGVGRIETKITMGSGTFYDGNGKEVTFGNGYTLKGMLIGGQSSVGWDFTPKGDENLTIYDRDMASSSIIAKPGYTTATANQTLALETKSNQVVNAALELINGGDDFMGADGMIPAGGTFYLVIKLDPTTASNYLAGTLDKIVKQDHVTKLTVTINNGSTFPDRNEDGKPDVYIKDEDGIPTGVDADGDGNPDPYDIDGDGNDDTLITDPDHGGPGWDTDGDGEVDLPLTPDNESGTYPDAPTVPEGLGNATNGIPDLTSPGVELGTSVNLEWQEGLILNPSI